MAMHSRLIADPPALLELEAPDAGAPPRASHRRKLGRMVAGGLLAAIRARVAARGMTFTDLARASGMQPGNLRRMLTSTTASPRLGSVMRLLPPLHARIAPAGARTAAELADFLEDQRQRNALTWDQLLGPAGLPPNKFAARLAADPEQLSLDVVMHLAEALHVELTLIADDEAPARNADERPSKQRSRTARHGPAPRQQPDRPAPPASPPTPASPREPSTPPTPIASTSPATTPGLGPLRPPRLGRYRDTPPEPTPPRPPSATWKPPEESHFLEKEVIAHLASLSSEDWSTGFAGVWAMLLNGAELPVRFIEGLGTWAASAFQRFRPPPPQRPPPPEPPDGCFDALDPGWLVHFWVRSRQPDPPAIDKWLHDELGVKVLHVALDSENAVIVRLAPNGCPHRLIQGVHMVGQGQATDWLHTEIPLAIKIGGEHHNFAHVSAGPVVGEIIIRERAYLLAVVSSLLALVEVHAEGMRVVWGGRPERLSEVDLEMPPQIAPKPAAPTDTAAPAVDLAGPTGRLEEETRKRIEAETTLAAERSSRDEERRALQTTTKKLAVTTAALEAAQQALNAMQAELTLQSQASTNAQRQVQMAREGANQLLDALLSKNKAYDQALEERQAAEARATEAEQAYGALLAERAELLLQLDDQANTAADALAQLHAQLAVERDRRSNAESLAAARGLEVEAQKVETADLRQAVEQLVALRREPSEPDRLAEVQKELDELRQAHANDAAHIRELIESHRLPELLSFFATRMLGVPVKDGDHALALLEEKLPLASLQPPAAEHPLPPEPLLPTANAPIISPGRAKIGRNEPCPCGSGTKYKRCCWLSSS